MRRMRVRVGVRSVCMRMGVGAVAIGGGGGEDVVLVRGAAPGIVVTPGELVDRGRRLRRWVEVHR